MSTSAQVVVAITLPTTRTDNTPLDVSEIASVTVSKSVDGAPSVMLESKGGPFVAAPLIYNDDAPDFGSSVTYSVVVEDAEANVSTAGTAGVKVPPSKLAAPNAPQVTATFNA